MANDPQEYLPLSALDFQVLAVLVPGPLHGYAIVQETQRRFPDQRALEIGSLYRIISRMLDDALIEEVAKPEGVPVSRRKRRFYQATDLGHAVLYAEAERVRSLLAVADGLGLKGVSR